MLKNMSSVSKNKTGVAVLVLGLILGGVSAQASGILNTASGGYLVCVNTKSKVVAHPGTLSCPKGSKKLLLGAQGSPGAIGLTGAAGLSGKDGRNGTDGKTLWNGTTDPVSTWGAPGDMFINSVTKTLFGPKDLTTGWPAGFSMVGPKGDQGLIGLTGASGPQGPGGSGPSGPQGPAGANGTNGTAAALTCAQGGTCALGDTGPGGGTVFIVQTATATAPWRYMEAAPNAWSGGSADPQIAWCNNSTSFVPNLLTGSDLSLQTSAALGQGFTNTQKMLKRCSHGAANAVASYNGGGKSNWHLPSRDELNALYAQKTSVGGFVGNFYWSSSEFEASDAWFQLFLDGTQGGGGSKSYAFYVRPVRAF